MRVLIHVRKSAQHYSTIPLLAYCTRDKVRPLVLLSCLSVMRAYMSCPLSWARVRTVALRHARADRAAAANRVEWWSKQDVSAVLDVVYAER